MISILMVLLIAGGQEPVPASATSSKVSAALERRITATHVSRYRIVKTTLGYGSLRQEWARVDSGTKSGEKTERSIIVDFWECASATAADKSWEHVTSLAIGPGVEVDGPWEAARAWWSDNERAASHFKFRIENTITDVSGPKSGVIAMAEDVARTIAEELKAK